MTSRTSQPAPPVPVEQLQPPSSSMPGSIGKPVVGGKPVVPESVSGSSPVVVGSPLVVGSPPVVVGSPPLSPPSPTITVIGFGTTALLWIGIGLAMRALVLQGDHATLSAADQAAPEFLTNYTSPVLAGVVFAGLFAAIMSTVDAFLNIGAAAVVHDIPKAFGKTVNRELLWARVATVLIALLATGFGLYGGELVGLLAAFGWGTFAAALVPTVGIGLNWKRATPAAACVAIAVSLLVNFSIKVFAIPMPFGIDPGAVALLVSLVLFIGISLCSRPAPIDPDIEEVMEL